MMSSVAQASNGPAFFAVLVELQCIIAVIAIKDKKTICRSNRSILLSIAQLYSDSSTYSIRVHHNFSGDSNA
jgi:hypothetical protein